MSAFWKDIQYSIRTLIRTPGFTIITLLTLALGIGANTAIFSVINAVLLRSLPVPNPHELRTINWMGRNPELSHYTGSGMGETSTGMRYAGSFPYPAYQDFKHQNKDSADVFAYFQLYSTTLMAHSESSTADGMMVSGNFFSGYGAKTLIGRTITEEDDRPGATPVAVITYRWWEQHFNLDSNVLGETITVNKNPFTIIGVLPKEYVGPIPGDPNEIYVPLSEQPHLAPSFPLESSKHWWIEMMARLKPGTDESQLKSSLETSFRQVLSESITKMEQPQIRLEDGSRGPLLVRQRMSQPMLALLAIVGLVLLIACANLTSLLLVRGVSRQHEIAIRSAIGAGRWRIIRQSLIESIVISLFGAAIGLVFAEWGKSLLSAFFTGFLDNLNIDTRTDFNVLLFTLGLSMVTALLSGIYPALRASRINPVEGLKDRTSIRSPRLKVGKILVTVQTGLTLLLIMVAGLMIQSFINLSQVNPGFNPENMLIFRLSANQAGYTDKQSQDFFTNVRKSISAIPGVNVVALSDIALIGGGISATSVKLPGKTANPEARFQTNLLHISDSFFSTMGIRLLQGRDFDLNDTPESPKTVIVNETFVKTFLLDLQPLGQIINDDSNDFRIIGVCKDAKYHTLRDDVPPTMYLAFQQKTRKTGIMNFEVRSVLPPLSLLPSIRKSIAAIDPTIPLTNIKTQQQYIEISIIQERLAASLCGFFALLALLLSCIGLYGLMAYTVKRRTGEIGIRMALGARPRDVAMPIIREAFILSSSGVLIAMPVFLAVARFGRSVLFGIQPYDPLTMLGGSMLLVIVVTLAAWLPARRAARVDPMTALRCE